MLLLRAPFDRLERVEAQAAELASTMAVLEAELRTSRELQARMAGIVSAHMEAHSGRQSDGAGPR